MKSPTVIIEVLSDATAAYDRGDKFRTYRQISSFREYVLIDPERRTVEVFRRQGDPSRWELSEVKRDEALQLLTTGSSIAWRDLFEDVA